MTFSLIIAAYNRGSRIADTIESVLAQTRPVDEVIVVDDGSPDATGDWVEQHFPAVRVLRKVNGGTSSARNAGAKVANNDWLIFLDHDDLLLPEAVQTFVDLSQRFPAARALHCDHIYDNSDSGERHENHHYQIPAFERLLRTPCEIDTGSARLYGRPLFRSLIKGNLLQQPFAILRDAFLEAGGYAEDVKYCEDWDLYLRVSMRFPVAVSDQVISIHRIEGDNLHLTAAEKQEAMYHRVLHRLIQTRASGTWAEQRLIRHKLAAIEKTRGDRARAGGDARSAWLSYWRSACWWPIDHVVVARLAAWAPAALAGNKASSRHEQSL